MRYESALRVTIRRDAKFTQRSVIARFHWIVDVVWTSPGRRSALRDGSSCIAIQSCVAAGSDPTSLVEYTMPAAFLKTEIRGTLIRVFRIDGEERRTARRRSHFQAGAPPRPAVPPPSSHSPAEAANPIALGRRMIPATRTSRDPTPRPLTSRHFPRAASVPERSRVSALRLLRSGVCWRHALTRHRFSSSEK